MENKRLEQDHASGGEHLGSSQGRDWRRVKDLQEELRQVGPVFARLESASKPEPSAQEWRDFSQKLARRLDAHKAPLFQTLRDKITATDAGLLRWFWVIVALLVLAIVAGVVALSLHGISSLPTAPQLSCSKNSRPAAAMQFVYLSPSSGPDSTIL